MLINLVALIFPIRTFYALHFVSPTLELKLICLYKGDAWPDAVLFPCVTTEKHYGTELLLPGVKMHLKMGLLQASKCNPKISAGRHPACSNLSSCKDVMQVVGAALLSGAVLPFPLRHQPQHPSPLPKHSSRFPRAKPAAASVWAAAALAGTFCVIW